MSKHFLASALQSRLGDRVLRFLERAGAGRSNLFKVLTYHRVKDPAGFSRQMEYLAAHYRVIAVPDLLGSLKSGAPLPPFSVAITFDDAHREFGEVAWPILQRLRLPVTLFVPTGFPDRPDRVFWWERVEDAFLRTPLHSFRGPTGILPLANARERRLSLKTMKEYLKTLPQDEIAGRAEEVARLLQVPASPPQILGWDELRRLAREGVTMGAHSRSHPLMDRISAAEARAEVSGSLEDLRREIGEAPPIFSYPDGRYGPATLEVLREAGILLAFTTRRGTNELGRTPSLELRRINIQRCAPTSVLRLRLIHSSIYLNRWQPLYDR